MTNFVQKVAPKPPIVKGWFFKRGDFLGRMNRRYFIINPDEGTFIRYAKQDDYPFKPLEVIPLKDITAAHRVNSNTQSRKDLFYIQVVMFIELTQQLLYHNKKHLLATNNEENANK